MRMWIWKQGLSRSKWERKQYGLPQFGAPCAGTVGVRWQVYSSLMRPQQWRWEYAKLICGMDSRLLHHPGACTHTHTHIHTHTHTHTHTQIILLHASKIPCTPISIHLTSSVEVDNILLSCRELLMKCSSHRSTRYVSNQICYYSNQIITIATELMTISVVYKNQGMFL